MKTRSCLLAFAVLVVAACSNGSSGSTLPADVEAILEASAKAMGEIDTVRFAIERGGAPVYIDPNDTLAFVSAEGRFAAPSSADALVQIAVGGLTTQIGAVAIEGTTWLSNPITGEFSPAPENYTFDPATLFDPDTGWRPLLAEDVREVELVGLEQRGEQAVYHLRGVAGQQRVAVITAGLVTGQDVTIDVWIDATTGEVAEVSFTALYRGEESTWDLVFTDYGAEVQIDPPPPASQG